MNHQLADELIEKAQAMMMAGIMEPPIYFDIEVAGVQYDIVFEEDRIYYFKSIGCDKTEHLLETAPLLDIKTTALSEFCKEVDVLLRVSDILTALKYRASQVRIASCFDNHCPRIKFGFHYKSHMGTFTVTNQLMFPRSHAISTGLTSGMPCPSKKSIAQKVRKIKDSCDCQTFISVFQNRGFPSDFPKGSINIIRKELEKE